MKFFGRQFVVIVIGLFSNLSWRWQGGLKEKLFLTFSTRVFDLKFVQNSALFALVGHAILLHVLRGKYPFLEADTSHRNRTSRDVLCDFL